MWMIIYTAEKEKMRREKEGESNGRPAKHVVPGRSWSLTVGDLLISYTLEFSPKLSQSKKDLANCT